MKKNIGIILGIIIAIILLMVSGCIEENNNHNEAFGTIRDITHDLDPGGQDISLITILIKNTGNVTGDLWIKSYKNSVFVDKTIYNNIVPGVTNVCYRYSTSESQSWVFECGHNDETSYDTTMSYSW